jgi:hypothetical protein
MDETIAIEPLITLHRMHRAVLQMRDDPSPSRQVIVVGLGAFSHLPYIAHGVGVVRADTVYEPDSYDLSIREYEIDAVKAH